MLLNRYFLNIFFNIWLSSISSSSSLLDDSSLGYELYVRAVMILMQFSFFLSHFSTVFFFPISCSCWLNLWFVVDDVVPVLFIIRLFLPLHPTSPLNSRISRTKSPFIPWLILLQSKKSILKLLLCTFTMSLVSVVKLHTSPFQISSDSKNK